MTFLWHHFIINTLLTTNICACICMCSIKQISVLRKWEKMVCHLMVIIFTLRFSVMINIFYNICSHVLSFQQTIYFCKDLIYVIKPITFRRCIFDDFLIYFSAIYIFFNFSHSSLIWTWFFIGSLAMKLHCNVLLWINILKIPFANTKNFYSKHCLIKS